MAPSSCQLAQMGVSSPGSDTTHPWQWMGPLCKCCSDPTLNFHKLRPTHAQHMQSEKHNVIGDCSQSERVDSMQESERDRLKTRGQSLH